jgi:hypothetical protein
MYITYNCKHKRPLRGSPPWGEPGKIYFIYIENHFNSKNIQKMPEYLLPFEENTIFIARTRQIQKRPFSLAVGAVIIPDV